MMGGFNTQFVKQEVRVAADRRARDAHARVARRPARAPGDDPQRDAAPRLLQQPGRRLRVAGPLHRRASPRSSTRRARRTRRWTLPPGYGYRLRASHRWRVSAMLMSHRMHATKVFIKYTVRVARPSRCSDVRPLWVRANGCGPASSYGVYGDGGAGLGGRPRRPLDGPDRAGASSPPAGTCTRARSACRCASPTAATACVYDNVPHYGPADALPLHRQADAARGRSGQHELVQVGDRRVRAQGRPARRPRALRGPVRARRGDGDHPHLHRAGRRRPKGGCAPLPADAHVRPRRRARARYVALPADPAVEARRARPARAARRSRSSAPIALGDNTRDRAAASRLPARRTSSSGRATRCSWRFDDARHAQPHVRLRAARDRGPDRRARA